MTAYIKSKQLFLVGKFFVIGSRRDHHACASSRRESPHPNNEIVQPSIAQRRRRAESDSSNAGKKFRAIAANKINAPP